MESYRKGAAIDSVYATKYNNLIDEVGVYKKQPGKKCFEADLLTVIYQIKKGNSKPIDQRDLFGPGLAYYQCGNFQKSDTMFTAYIAAFPDSVYGYLWKARIEQNFDTTMALGLAVPFYEKTLTIAETDKVRFKQQGVTSAGYLAGYSNNIKKDKAAAISYMQRGLAFDSTNEEFLKNIKILSQSPKTTPPTRNNGTNKQSAATKPPILKQTSKALATN